MINILNLGSSIDFNFDLWFLKGLLLWDGTSFRSKWTSRGVWRLLLSNLVFWCNRLHNLFLIADGANLITLIPCMSLRFYWMVCRSTFHTHRLVVFGVLVFLLVFDVFLKHWKPLLLKVFTPLNLLCFLLFLLSFFWSPTINY